MRGIHQGFVAVVTPSAPGESADPHRPRGRKRHDAELYEDAVRRGEGLIAADGPLVVRTGKHTGRSPDDKFIVDEPGSRDKIWWGTVNRPIDEANYDRLRARLMEYCADRDLYAQDCFIGAAPAHRRSLRVYTETAWASIFARNLFRRPTPAQLRAFEPNFTIIDVPSFQADPATEGTRSGTAILVHLERMEIIIVGTEYAGEIKKSAFTVMNYLMPDEGVLPMHSAINVGQDGDPAVFFGLSGTGKTTLSADPLRSLIGDDEHGWGDGLTFNFEGGCYAKTIRLSPMYEPDIFQTTRRFGTVLENVDLDPRTRELDLDSERFTENTRGAYPLDFIGNADETGIAGHAERPSSSSPPTRSASCRRSSRLTREQAAYHFISGYTAKLAGTEVGVKEPKATFSACFGAPFMPRHPGEYARDARRPSRARRRPGLARQHRLDRRPVRGRRADEHRPHPGRWSGPRSTEALADVPTRRRPELRARGPDVMPGRAGAFLDPRATWADPDAYDRGRGPAGGDVPRQLRGLRRRRAAKPIAAAGPGGRPGGRSTAAG